MKDGLENIDQVFKQAFDGFEGNVDPSVWTNIQQALASGSGTTPQTDPVSSIVGSTATKAVVLKVAVAALAVVAIASLSYLAFNNNTTKVVAENNPVDPIETKEEPTPIVEILEPAEVIIENTTEIKTTTVKTVQNNNPEVPVVSSVKEEESTLMVKETEPQVATSKVTIEKEMVKEEVKIEKATIAQTANTETEKAAPTASSSSPIKEEVKLKVKIADPIPNVITPNGDGENDVIKISGQTIDKMELAIMDKTGKVLYLLRSIEDEWNGKDMAGFDLVPGAYYMVGTLKDKDGNIEQIKQVINLFK